MFPISRGEHLAGDRAARRVPTRAVKSPSAGRRCPRSWHDAACAASRRSGWMWGAVGSSPTMRRASVTQTARSSRADRRGDDPAVPLQTGQLLFDLFFNDNFKGSYRERAERTWGTAPIIPRLIWEDSWPWTSRREFLDTGRGKVPGDIDDVSAADERRPPIRMVQGSLQLFHTRPPTGRPTMISSSLAGPIQERSEGPRRW